MDELLILVYAIRSTETMRRCRAGQVGNRLKALAGGQRLGLAYTTPWEEAMRAGEAAQI